MSFQTAEKPLKIDKVGGLGRPKAKVRATFGRVGGQGGGHRRLLESDKGLQNSSLIRLAVLRLTGGGGSTSQATTGRASVVCCMWSGVCGMWHVVCCLWHEGCHVVCCLWHVVCYLWQERLQQTLCIGVGGRGASAADPGKSKNKRPRRGCNKHDALGVGGRGASAADPGASDKICQQHHAHQFID